MKWFVFYMLVISLIMKRIGRIIIRTLFLVYTIVLCIPACVQRETDIPTPNLTFTDKVDPDFQSVTLSCTVSGNVTAERLFIEYAKNPDLTGAHKNAFEHKGGSFVITIPGLEIQTTYYYRYLIENKASYFVDEEIRQFKTLDYTAPTVLTGDAKDVTGTKAVIDGKVEFACGKAILDQGFYIGTDTQNLEAKSVPDNDFSLSLDNLSFETTYYYQAYAKSEIGIGKGAIKSFKTRKAVAFNQVIVEDISATGIVAKSGVADSDGVDVDIQGFRYSEGTSDEFTFEECTDEKNISGLKPATSYKIWYYAKTYEGEFESEKVEFKTKDGVVLITTSPPTNVSATSATLKANISSDGGSPITERGFFYGKDEDPSLTGTKIKVSGTTGEYQHNLTNLPQNSQYYVRAYAINAIGTYYGESVAFSTSYDSVTFGTLSYSNVTATSASFTCSITYNGGSTITRCGFCYSTSSLPTFDNQVVEVTGSQTALTASAKNLKSGESYHVRAFATNANSTFYSDEITFVTQDGIVQFSNPTVSNILVNSATLTSSIISAGGGTISEIGFCYSTSSAPTVSKHTITVSGTTGAMSGTISGLTNNTEYYVRAFATNETGTSYSSELVFSTLSGLAEVETTGFNSITTQSVEVSGNVITANGGAITARGFCYGTNESPTIFDNKVTVSGTTGAMSKTISGLASDTKYYIRAYATTSYGTSYGNVLSFTTVNSAVSFSVVTASDIKASSATVSVNIVSTGGSAITEQGFCYSTSEMPSISDKKIVVSSADASYSTTLMSLSCSQKYYVRAYAKDLVGTHYSSQATFTTLSGLPALTSVSVNNVTSTTINLTGSITSDGGADITQRGFCYSLSPNPTIGSRTLSIVGTTGTMTGTLSNLIPASLYYIKAYAQTAYGTSYSDEIYISTDSAIPVSEITLNESSIVLILGESEALIPTVKPDDATDKTVVWKSSNTSVASVSEGIVVGLREGTATITASAGNFSATCSVTVRKSSVAIPDAVDLGLSVKWASFNVGASSPEEYGDYYAWGETEPYYTEGHSQDNPCNNWNDGKNGYIWSSYKWSVNSNQKFTRYCQSDFSLYWGGSGSPDGKLDFCDYDYIDDAAYAKLGKKWRTPTEAEWLELTGSSTWTWTDNYNGTGVAGCIVTSNVEGFRKKSIFIPACGNRSDMDLSSAGSIGNYWLSSIWYFPNKARSASFDQYTYWSYTDGALRYEGKCIRPVMIE